MKAILSCAAALTVSLLFLPMISLPKEPAVLPTAATVSGEQKGNRKNRSKGSDEIFAVYDKTTDKITNYSAEDYLFGVVAAEMPATYETEALKAQAVAAYTFACRRKTANREQPYDITSDPATDQNFMCEEVARSCWGERADEYAEKIRDCVQSVVGETVTYNGEPALTVYHAVSSGMTEAAVNVWGKEIPYLVAVDSSADRLAKNYRSTVTLTVTETAEKLKNLCTLSGNADKWFGNFERSPSGRVLHLTANGTKLTGEQIRSALNLHSADFTVEYKDETFTFEVCGYGHGVGMSQNGANEMAKQGSTYLEILKRYYVGCEVGKS